MKLGSLLNHADRKVDTVPVQIHQGLLCETFRRKSRTPWAIRGMKLHDMNHEGDEKVHVGDRAVREQEDLTHMTNRVAQVSQGHGRDVEATGTGHRRHR